MKVVTIVVDGNDLDLLGFSRFFRSVYKSVNKHKKELHFYGGTPWGQPISSGCLVFTATDSAIEALRKELEISHIAYPEGAYKLAVSDGDE